MACGPGQQLFMKQGKNWISWGQLCLQGEQLVLWLGKYSFGFFFSLLSYCLVSWESKG